MLCVAQVCFIASKMTAEVQNRNQSQQATSRVRTTEEEWSDKTSYSNIQLRQRLHLETHDATRCKFRHWRKEGGGGRERLYRFVLVVFVFL